MTVPVGDKYDFYTTALHEIGYILGLSTGWDDWLDLVSGGAFTGSAAIADFNADNHVNVASLALEPNKATLAFRRTGFSDLPLWKSKLPRDGWSKKPAKPRLGAEARGGAPLPAI
ncbi:MAG: hypothetical protein R3F11_21345 [Verrucomicrobiales bacterium]